MDDVWETLKGDDIFDHFFADFGDFGGDFGANFSDFGNFGNFGADFGANFSATGRHKRGANHGVAFGRHEVKVRYCNKDLCNDPSKDGKASRKHRRVAAKPASMMCTPHQKLWEGNGEEYGRERG